MSLQVWLPLYKNLNNQGICDTIQVTSDEYQRIDSQFGEGLSLSQRVNFTGLPKLSNFSIFFWVRVDSCTLDWADILGFNCNKSDETTASEFRFEATKTSRACSWHNNGVSGYGISSGTRILIENYSEWHHVGVVYTGDKIYSYIDGNLSYTDSGLGGYLTTDFHIGETGNVVGVMNDLRIYDHILSKKEIKDIYNICLLHYRFDDDFIKENLIVESNNINSWVAERCTKTQENDVDFNNCIKVVGSEANCRIYREVKNVWTTKGETFTVSFWAKSLENGVTVDMSRSVLDFSEKFTLTTEWRRYVGHITNTTSATDGTLSFRIHLANKTVYITNIKLSRGTEDTNWNPNASDELYDELGFNDLVVYDESGFGFNGEKSKKLLLSSDNAMGTKSLNLIGETYDSYIRVPDYPQLEKDFTWNVWVKQSDKTLPKTLQTILSQGRDYTGNTANGADCGFNMLISNGIPEIRYGNWTSSKNGNILLSAGEALDDQWHMITASIDSNGIGRIYIDGKLKKTATTSTTCAYSQATGNLVIGKMSYQYTSTNQFFPLNGLIDDIKLFACTLSDDDIERMYNTKMFIDKNGVISGNNFTELRQNSFYFNIDNMNRSDNSVLEVVDCTAKSIRLKFKQAPNTWQGKYFPLEDFIQDGKTYTVYMRPNKDCNKNLADGIDNQYGRTYGIIGVYRYKISDNSVVKLEWQLKEIKTYIGRFTVDYTTYKNYQLRLYPNCTDTTSWNNGDYIYDYVDIVPEEEDYNTNISKQSCFTTGEFLEDESNNKPQIEKYNRTKINKLTEI